MKFKKRFLMVFCTVALLAGMLGGGSVVSIGAKNIDWSKPATLKAIYLDLNSSEDPIGTFANLPLAAQKAILDDMQNIQVREVSSPLFMVTDSVGCADTYIEARSGIGEFCYSFEQVTWYYYDGSIITSTPSVQTYANTALFWAYDGIRDQSLTFGPGNTFYTAYKQAGFHYNIFWYEYHEYPWIRHTVNGDGTNVKQWGIGFS